MRIEVDFLDGTKIEGSATLDEVVSRLFPNMKGERVHRLTLTADNARGVVFEQEWIITAPGDLMEPER